jgi:hypothetical protein
MKNSTPLTASILFKTMLIITLLAVLTPVSLSAQAVGTWSFGGTLAGTGTASNTVGAASLGSGIAASGFSSGVYYGEGTWPAGAIDPTDYLQFSLAPNSGHMLNLSGITMNIRRSTTGTAAGSGPNNWSLRSSLDGFSTDITTGVLSLNTSPTTNVALGAAFNDLTSTITFRLYGYNATVTSGGLNRFCYQNITVNGLIILPILLQDFHVGVLSGNAVQLTWALNGGGTVSSIQVERSSDGVNFNILQNMVPMTDESVDQYKFVDASVTAGDENLFYRVKVTNNDNQIYYSEILKVTFAGKDFLSIVALPVQQFGNVGVKVNAPVSDNYHFYLYGINGAQVAVKSIALTNGIQIVHLDNTSLHTGMYVLMVERNGEKVSTKLMVQ